MQYKHQFDLNKIHKFDKWCIIRQENTNKLQPKGFYKRLLDYDSQNKKYIIYYD